MKINEELLYLRVTFKDGTHADFITKKVEAASYVLKIAEAQKDFFVTMPAGLIQRDEVRMVSFLDEPVFRKEENKWNG